MEQVDLPGLPGRPPLFPTRLTLRLDPEASQWLAATAAVLGVSQAQLVRTALRAARDDWKAELLADPELQFPEARQLIEDATALASERLEAAIDELRGGG